MDKKRYHFILTTYKLKVIITNAYGKMEFFFVVVVKGCKRYFLNI